FFIRGRTDQKFIVTLVATVAMLLLYAWLIPAYGALGAALATVGGFAVLAVTTLLTTQRIFFVEYEWPRLLALTLLALAVWLVAAWLPTGPWGLLARIALLASLLVSIWFSPLIHV